MRAFEYRRPQSLDELFDLVRQHGSGAQLLAGGTDLVVNIRKGFALPRVVIDLKRVAGLPSGIAVTDGVVRIGARAVMTDLLEEKMLREYFPGLVEAARVVGSVQIRNRATLAGNLCNASPGADTAPVLLAYEARINLISTSGRRTLPLEDFLTGPRRTALMPGEVVESIDIPMPAVPTGSAFGRVTRQHGVDLAIVSVCCAVRESGAARLAFGAVGPRPFVVTATTDTDVTELVRHTSPISDLRAGRDYRLAMIPVLARRTLDAALARLHERTRRA